MYNGTGPAQGISGCTGCTRGHIGCTGSTTGCMGEQLFVLVELLVVLVVIWVVLLAPLHHLEVLEAVVLVVVGGGDPSLAIAIYKSWSNFLCLDYILNNFYIYIFTFVSFLSFFQCIISGNFYFFFLTQSSKISFFSLYKFFSMLILSTKVTIKTSKHYSGK